MSESIHNLEGHYLLHSNLEKNIKDYANHVGWIVEVSLHMLLFYGSLRCNVYTFTVTVYLSRHTTSRTLRIAIILLRVSKVPVNATEEDILSVFSSAHSF